MHSIHHRTRIHHDLFRMPEMPLLSVTLCSAVSELPYTFRNLARQQNEVGPVRRLSRRAR